MHRLVSGVRDSLGARLDRNVRVVVVGSAARRKSASWSVRFDRIAELRATSWRLTLAR